MLCRKDIKLLSRYPVVRRLPRYRVRRSAFGNRYGTQLLKSKEALSHASQVELSPSLVCERRFLIGLCAGMETASKPLVEEVCGPEHNVVGMGYTTCM